MDGLAASLASISFFFFAVDAVTVHPDNASLAFAIAGAAACCGFLPFNLRPRGRALVFMGDSGSQALGFALAALGLVSSWRVAGTTVATLILPVLVLAVPILDTTLVTIARMLDGRPIHQGGRDHSSHRLVRYGLSERSAVALLALIAFSIGGSSLAYNVLDNWRYTVIGVVITFALLIQFASFLADVDRRAAARRAGLAHPGLRDALAPAGRGRGRLRPHQRRHSSPRTRSSSAGPAAPASGSSPGSLFPSCSPRATSRSSRSASTAPVWRYAGIRDAVAAAAAVAVSELIAVSFMVLTQDMRDFTRSFFIVDGLICMVAVVGSRIAERTLVIGTRGVRDRTARRTLIVGAGRTGRSLVRELRETAGERVVGFVDDNPRLRRRSVHGVKVVGTTQETARILESTEPDIVLVTIPDAPRDALDAVVSACADGGVACRFVRRELDLDPHVELGAASE